MSSGTLIIYIFLFRSFDGVSKKLSKNGPKWISNDEVRDTAKKTRSVTKRHDRGMWFLSVYVSLKLNATTGMKTRSDLKRHSRVILRFVRVLYWKKIATQLKGHNLEP